MFGRAPQRSAWAHLAAIGVAYFVLLEAGDAMAEPLPPAVAEMITAAAGDPEAFDTVVRVARTANPGSNAEIDGLVAKLKAQPAARTTVTTAGGASAGWKGKGEIGGNVSTGNTDESGVVLGLDLEKDAPRWWYSVDLSMDMKREDGELTKERYFIASSTQYKLSRRLYIVGVLWGEGDRFAGYHSRFSESLGVGYRFLDAPALRLRGEIGPALRQADYIAAEDTNSGSVRVAEYFTWIPNSRVSFTQRAISYLESGNSTFIGYAALTSTLVRELAARASVEVRHETQPPPGRKNTDTTSRLTLVYSF